jgi:DeoR/GlpR family transcriptional regulator of sugar metabolism
MVVYCGCHAGEVRQCGHPPGLHPAPDLRVMARHTKKRVVVADHSRLGAVSHRLLCPADEVQIIISDRDAIEDRIDPFRKKGIEGRQV